MLDFSTFSRKGISKILSIALQIFKNGKVVYYLFVQKDSI